MGQLCSNRSAVSHVVPSPASTRTGNTGGNSETFTVASVTFSSVIVSPSCAPGSTTRVIEAVQRTPGVLSNEMLSDTRSLEGPTGT